MPSAKKLFNLGLILFVLFSIPVTVLVARKAALNSNASTSTYSVQVTPSREAVQPGDSKSFQLELNFPDSVSSSKELVLVQFASLPSGVSIQNQPIGATPSNNYQKIHTFNILVKPGTKSGEYSVKVIMTNLTKISTTAFRVVVK